MSTYYVSPGGDDGGPGTEGSPWRTLSRAASAVAGGDEVVLRAGAYAGGVSFDAPDLLIRSYQGERAVITAPINNSSIEQALALDTGSSGTTLRGLEVVGGYYYCIKFQTDWSGGATGGSATNAARNITIEDCVLHGSGRDVIKITPGCDDVTIRRNEIYDSGLRDASNAEGIDNVNGDRMVVQDNHIHDIATNGLYPKGGASGAVIERNRIERCGNLGLALGYYTDIEFFDLDNTLYYESIDATVRNNVIVSTGHAGIGLYGSLRSRVYNNTVVNPAGSAQAGILFAPGETGGIRPNAEATVANNVVRMGNTRPAVQVRSDGYTAGAYPSMGNNLYSYSGGTASFADARSGFSGTLAQWEALVTSDASSSEADPLLDAAGRLTAGSPAIDAGRDLSSEGFADDLDRQARPSGAAWDVGADEYGADDPGPDTTPPTVVSRTPADGATGVAHGATVRVGFSEIVRPETVFVEMRDAAGGVVPGAVAYEPATRSAVLDPSADLAPSMTYTVTVRSAADPAGNVMDPVSWSFTTAAPPTTVFSPFPHFGDFANYTARTPSRWQVTPDAGTADQRLAIATTDYTGPAEDVLGEYAVVNGRVYGDFDLSVRARTDENLAANPSADYVVVFGYQDASNYSYVMFSARPGNTRFFRVAGGVPTAYPAAATAGIADANFHTVRVTRTGPAITASVDGTEILASTDPGLSGAGLVGVGSYNDAASFDDLSVNAEDPVTVARRSVFYNNSIFDGQDPAVTEADLAAAVATDKQPLLPGQTASFANVTNYVNGINGLFIEFAGEPPARLTAADFAFRTGKTADPSTWTTVPPDPAVTLLAIPDGQDVTRYALTWPDEAIKNTWLQVTVPANARTGLSSPDVFYFGNLIGDTGNALAGAATTGVNAQDLAAVKRNLTTRPGITGVYDFTKDGQVNAQDIAALKRYLTATFALFAAPPNR